MTPAERVSRRLSALQGLRQPHESRWRECFDYTYPERSGGLEGAVVTSQDAASKRADIYDDTAPQAAQVLASAMAAGLTPANSVWLQYKSGSNDHAEATWLGEAAKFVWTNIHAGNFDSASAECLLDMSAGPGAFVLYMEEAKEGGLHFEQWPFGQCYVSATKSGGRIDTIYRVFELTIEQLVAEYGLENCSAPVREKFNAGTLDEKVSVLWAIEPRDAAKLGSGPALAKAKPFASTHMECGSKHVLREAGYDEFPCAVPRWRLIPGSHYGTGPMSTVLPSVKTVNELQKLELVNLEMSAYGMFKARDDGVLNPFATKIGPRRVVVVADMDNFEPVERGGDFKISFAKKEELQGAIRRGLMADHLQPQDGPAMTATEVHARIMLIRQQMGPAFGRFQAEYLQTVAERCFGLALRSGALEFYCGPMPESLRGRSVAITFDNPLSRAQKLEEVTAVDTWVNGVLAVAQATQDQSQLDVVDLDEVAQIRAEGLSVPAKARRSVDDIARVRKQRVAAQQQAQQQQQAAELQQEAGKAAITAASRG